MARPRQHRASAAVNINTAVALCRLPGFHTLRRHPVSLTVGRDLSSRFSSQAQTLQRATRAHIPISQIIDLGKSSPTDSKQASPSAQGAASSGNATPPAVDSTKQAGGSREAASGDASVSKSKVQDVKQISPSDASGETLDVEMRKADGDTSADATTQEAGTADSESKAPDVSVEGAPEFKKPRHATLEDVRGLIFAGMLRQEEVNLPDFLVPECPPHWKLPDPPNLKTNAYLVRVPGTVNDIRAGAFAMEGYGGATTLIGFEELSVDDLQELMAICGVRGGVDVLNPRRSPLSSYDLDNSLNSIGVRREVASLLRHFNSTRSMRSLAVAQQGPTAIQQAVDALRKNKELKRSWKFTCDYWFLELQEALGKLDSTESEHKIALQEQKTRYQDEIDFLESERAELKARLADSEAQVRILKSRLESATVDPWKFSDFLQEHTDFTGNWERLHDLFKLCVKDTKPPESWDTVVNVAAMDKRKAAVAPYPEKSQRMPPSSGSDSTNRPEVLDLTGSGNNSQSGSGAGNETQGAKGSQISKKNSEFRQSQGSKTSDKQLQPTASKVRKVQRRPKDHQPGRDSVRRAGEKTVVSKEAAHSMLHGGVVWKEFVRTFVRLFSRASYTTSAMEWIGNDRAAHGHFRQPQLVKMLVSMMYWRRLDRTPWSKYVSEAYYEMADERLDRRLRRGDVPAPWGNLDDHVVYPDEDAGSTVDDVENDPEYQPPTQEPEESSSGSSYEEEDEEVAPEILDEDDDAENDDDVEAKATLESKPPAKRPRSGSIEKSQGSNPKLKKQRRKATKKNTSAPQSSNGSLGNKVVTRPKHPSVLARKSYAELTVDDLQTAEDPEYGETSWRIYGVLTPGFPEYEIHKYSYDVVQDRWNRGAYQEVLDSGPWVTMLQGRIRVFYFHERDMLYAKALKLVEDIVDAIVDTVVSIPTEEKADSVLESQRKSRRNALRRAFKTLLDRSHDTPGFLPSLWNEPGLWQFPDKCCYWIWEDPRAEELGGPSCKNLDLQLATLDMREPARVQWSTAIDDEVWLQYVPNNVKRHVKPAAIRKHNPLSLTHS
ncbi:Hypothetical protein PHPALM_37317 [Phytophthora palmivora]|uniref:Uncharacterized protein n=1 Tax=Phytophthora palmivora TaxID=4796 RepID=A0A2P4WXQ6_9STRA|nr:Hypothetical protein PHPALM_37317 [Phytophthora palmivora]